MYVDDNKSKVSPCRLPSVDTDDTRFENQISNKELDLPNFLSGLGKNSIGFTVLSRRIWNEFDTVYHTEMNPVFFRLAWKSIIQGLDHKNFNGIRQCQISQIARVIDSRLPYNLLKQATCKSDNVRWWFNCEKIVELVFEYTKYFCSLFHAFLRRLILSLEFRFS